MPTEINQPAKEANDEVDEEVNSLKQPVEKLNGVEKENKESNVIEDKFKDGKRQLICGDYCAAVKILSEVCEEMVEDCGQMDDKMADVYFQYGSALLEVAKMESTVLTGALEGVEDEEEEDNTDKKESEKTTQKEKMDIIEEEPITEDQEDEIAEKVIDAMCSEEDKETKNDVEEVKKDVKEAKKDVKEAKKDVEEVKKDVEEVKKDVEEVKKDIEEAEKDIEEAEKDIEEAEKDIEEAEKDVKEAEKEIKTAEKIVDETNEVQNGTPVKHENGSSDKVTENGNMEVDEEKSETENDDKDAESDNQNDDDEGEEGDEEEVTNLQLAWEMVELSRVIYTRQLEEIKADSVDDADQKKRRELLLNLSDVYIKLSDIGMEQGLYTQATTDAESAIEKMKLKLDMVGIPLDDAYADKLSLVSDYRELTELYFKKSLTLAMDDLYKDARESIMQCNDLLRKAITTCKESIENIGDSNEEFKTMFQKHLTDMEALIPELMEKHDDWIDEEKNKESTKEQIKQTLSKAINGKSDESNGNAKDITHLVRKKRTSDVGIAEASNGDSEPVSKKAKIDE